MKRPSFFPFILLALTLILVTAFVFSASPKTSVQKTNKSSVSTVSDEQYQTALTAVLKKFVSVYDAAASDTEKTQAVQNTLNSLLSMRVPAEEKDLHLELALALQKMKQGFATNPQDILEGYASIKELISQTSWLHI